MRCQLTRKNHDHFPKIKADRSGSGAHLIDKGDGMSSLFPPLIIGGIAGIVIAIFCMGVLGPQFVAAILGVVALIAGYSFLRRFKVYKALCPGELFVQQWPLRRNESIRIRYLRLIKTSATVQSVTARLQCVESATYQQGTDTRTVTETVYTADLEEVEREGDLDKIQVDWQLEIPAYKPPSLDVYRNEIRWSVVVALNFNEIPEDDSTFALLVGPEVLA